MDRLTRAEHEANAKELGTKLCRVCDLFAIPGFEECAFHIAFLEFRYVPVLADE